jgi:hypothetical protein
MHAEVLHVETGYRKIRRIVLETLRCPRPAPDVHPSYRGSILKGVENWLAQNWYLVIPWVSGIAGWYVARQRHSRHPVRWAVVSFLLGCLVVLAFDLAPRL